MSNLYTKWYVVFVGWTAHLWSTDLAVYPIDRTRWHRIFRLHCL